MASRVERSPWLAEGEDKRREIKVLFSEIAPSYDRLNALISLGMHRQWRSQAVDKLELSPGMAALDVCCGTGDFLLPLRAKLGATGTLVGIDFAPPMLDAARAKTDASLCLGDACGLPVRSGSFDAVSVGWGLRNVPSVPQALREAFRALKPGGRFVSLDMARPRGFLGRMSESGVHFIVPLLGRLFGHAAAYKYLPQSTLSYFTPEETAQALKDAGFVDVGHRPLCVGNVCLHWGRKP